MERAKERLDQVLEIHFCDLEETNHQESILRKATNNYFDNLELSKYIKIFNALSDEKRIRIMILLTIREMCNCELTAAIGSSQPNLTYHIKILENAGLVVHRREGKFIYYSLIPDNTTNKILNMLK